MRSYLPLILLFALALAPSVTGCKKKCVVPRGTYHTKYHALDGDCPPELVKNFDGHEDDVKVTNAQCRNFSTNVPGKTQGGCKMTMAISAEARSDGIHNGLAKLTIQCDESKKNYSCHQNFAVLYTRAK